MLGIEEDLGICPVHWHLGPRPSFGGRKRILMLGFTPRGLTLKPLIKTFKTSSLRQRSYILQSWLDTCQ
jgi:hypothetical protein